MNRAQKNSQVVRACQLLAVPYGDKYYLLQGGSEAELFDASVASIVLEMSKLQSASDAISEKCKDLGWLQRIRVVAELSQLSAKLVNEIPLSRAGFVDAVEGAFGCLQQRGFVQTRDELLASLPEPRIREATKLSTLGVVTANRPLALRRCLWSYLSVARAFGRHLRVVVADDSRDAATVEENREIGKQASVEFGVSVELVGRKEREELIAARAGRDSDVEAALRFALYGYPVDAQTYGANRNMLQLWTRGEVLLSVDDDTICNPFLPKEFSGGVDIDVASATCETTRFWANRSEAMSSVSPFGGDPFIFLEESLGASVLELTRLALSRQEAAFQGFHRGIIEEVLLQQSRVSLAMYGVVGDSGSESGIGFIFDDITDPSPDYYEVASRSREVTRCVKNTTVRGDGPCMTMFFGCDNRNPLPIFFPNFRNEDYLFKEALRGADKGARVAYLPCLLEHSPLSTRTKTMRMVIDDLLTVDEFLSAAFSIARTHFNARSDMDPISAFGSCLVQLANLGPRTVQQVCVECALSRKAAGLERRRARLNQVGGKFPKLVRATLIKEQAEAEGKLLALSRELLSRNKTELWPDLAVGTCCDILRSYGQTLMLLSR